LSTGKSRLALRIFAEPCSCTERAERGERLLVESGSVRPVRQLNQKAAKRSARSAHLNHHCAGEHMNFTISVNKATPATTPNSTLPETADLRLGGTQQDALDLAKDLAAAYQTLASDSAQSLRTVVIRCRPAECSDSADPAVADDSLLKANYGILAARVPMFASMASGWRESQSDAPLQLSFPEFSMEALKKLLEFAYSGTTTVSRDSDDLIDLITAARYWQMDAVERATTAALTAELTAQNALTLLTLALHSEAQQLLASIAGFLARTAHNVLADSSFVSCDSTALLWLLQRSDLAAEESTVVQRVLDWLAANSSTAEPATVQSIADSVSWSELSTKHLRHISSTLNPAQALHLPLHSAATAALCACSPAAANTTNTNSNTSGSSSSTAQQQQQKRLRLRNPLLQYSPPTGFVWERKLVGGASSSTTSSSNTPAAGVRQSQLQALDLRRPGSSAKVCYIVYIYIYYKQCTFTEHVLFITYTLSF
jgi:BTB/POZ domain/BTB And C-terminal Kelch